MVSPCTYGQPGILWARSSNSAVLGFNMAFSRTYHHPVHAANQSLWPLLTHTTGCSSDQTLSGALMDRTGLGHGVPQANHEEEGHEYMHKSSLRCSADHIPCTLFKASQISIALVPPVSASAMSAKIYYENDASLALLESKTVVFIGYGNQGRAQCQNLRDVSDRPSGRSG